MAETSANPMQGLGSIFQRRPASSSLSSPDGPLPNGMQRLTLEREQIYLVVAREVQTTIQLFSEDSDLQINPVFAIGKPQDPSTSFQDSGILHKGATENLRTKTYNIKYQGQTLSVNALKVRMSALVFDHKARLRKNPVQQGRIQFHPNQVFKVLKLTGNGYVDVWSSGPDIVPQAAAQNVNDVNSKVSQLLANGWTSVLLQPGPYYYFRSAGPGILQLYSPEYDLLIAHEVDDIIATDGAEEVFYKGTTPSLKCEELTYIVVWGDTKATMTFEGVKLRKELTIYDMSTPPAQVLFRTDQIRSVLVESDNYVRAVVWENRSPSPQPSNADEGSSSGESSAAEFLASNEE